MSVHHLFGGCRYFGVTIVSLSVSTTYGVLYKFCFNPALFNVRGKVAKVTIGIGQAFDV